MASADLLSNDYSDHSLLSLESGNLKVTQLNLAQLGRLQIFPNDRVPEGFNWSSTLRTAQILRLVSEEKQDLTYLGDMLVMVARAETLSLEQKNHLLEKQGEIFVPVLLKLGFSVKSFKMAVNKLFNPGVSPNLLAQNPDGYIKGPAFVLEDEKSFSSRMEAGIDALLSSSPDFAAAQEVEHGESDGINFTKIYNGIMKKYPNYRAATHAVENTTLVVTFYRKDKYEDVTDESVSSLREELKCFGESEHKINVGLFKNKEGVVFTVVNIHADYGKSNREDPWLILRQLFKITRNLVVCGDFNLTLKNRSYFSIPFDDYSGCYTILETPEPVDVGNPTYDLIIM